MAPPPPPAAAAAGVAGPPCPRGLLPKHVADACLRVDGVKLGRKGRLALYKAAHAYIMATVTLAEEAAAGRAGEGAGVEGADVVAAVEALGFHTAATKVSELVASDARKAAEAAEAAELKKQKAAAKRKRAKKKE